MLKVMAFRIFATLRRSVGFAEVTDDEGLLSMLELICMVFGLA
jgi:hypothetical protein